MILFRPILFFLSIQLLTAQHDIPLPGVVVEQNSEFRTGSVIYLSNAEIKSAGAIPQHSDAKGRFTLVFSDRPSGNVARIYVAKSGYEVVNAKELAQASVIGRLRPLKVVMCAAGLLYENQITYYNIARDASIDGYNRKMAILEKEGKEKDRLLSELQSQFDQDIKTKDQAIGLLDKQRKLFEKQAKELADKWVTVNLDDESSIYQRAFAAFEGKNLELAMTILDSVDLEGRLKLNSLEKEREENLRDKLQMKIVEREVEIMQDVNMCLFKARLHQMDLEFQKAEHFYDIAIKYNRENVEILFEAGHFLLIQNQFKKAKNYYKKALQISRLLAKENPDAHLSDVAMALNDLGSLRSVNKDMAGAKNDFEEALSIRRRLAKKNPDVYLPEVAGTLNNLGILLKNNHDKDGAESAFGEALEIRRRLAKKNPDGYLPQVAMTLNNLGNLHSDNNNMASAEDAYSESLQIFRQLAKKNSTYLLDEALELVNLGLLYKENKNLAGAETAYEDALRIVRQFAKKNPDANLPHVAGILNNQGLLLKDNNNNTGAEIAFREALGIYQSLVKKNSDVFLPKVATTFNNLGILLKKKNRIEAESAIEEALAIRRLLVKKNPDVYLPQVAKTLNDLGDLQYGNGDRTKAKCAYEEALRIYRSLAKKNPDVYLPHVARILNNLGILLEAKKDMAGAERAYDEALKIGRRLAKKKPIQYGLDVAMTDINLALFYCQEMEKTKDISLKPKGLGLMKDAEKHLLYFDRNQLRVQQYRSEIRNITKFFENFE